MYPKQSRKKRKKEVKNRNKKTIGTWYYISAMRLNTLIGRSEVVGLDTNNTH